MSRPQPLALNPDEVRDLAGFVREVTLAESTQQVFDCTARWLRKILPCERAAVALADGSPGSLRLVSMEGIEAIPGEARLPLHGTVVGRCLLLGAITGSDETQGREEPDLQALFEHGVRSSRCVPLQADGEIAGALCLGRITPRGFDPRDEALMTEVAAITATHLAMHLRVDAALLEVSSLQDLNRKSAILSRLVTDLTLVKNEQEITQLVTRSLPELLEVEQASLALLVPGTQQVRLIAIGGDLDHPVPESTIDLLGSGFDACITTRQVQHIPDFRQDGHPAHGPLEAYGLRSSSCFPLTCGAETIGALRIARSTPGTPSEASAAQIEQLSTLVAHALVGVWTQSTLHQAQLDSEKLAQAKGLFLATVSHELRTPLNGVNGVAELLRETPLDEDQIQLVNALDRSVATLRRLVDDVLTFSKLESGKNELGRSEFDPVRVFDSSLQAIRSAGVEPGVELASVIHHSVPPAAIGDEARLKQVLVNLLSNAIKFTVTGSVMLEARATRIEGQWELEVEVHDSGPGIAPERQDKIFEPLHQEECSGSLRFGGTGLGLAICRELCVAMGGDIRLDSVPGKGSCFTFRVRLEAGAEHDAPTPLDGMTVGLRTSSALLSRSMETSLTALGATCLPAGAGACPDTEPDIWILDRHLDPPTAPCANEQSGQRPPPRILHLATDREPASLQSTGISPQVLPRGITRGELAIALQDQVASGQQPQPSQSILSRRILIVDDNPVNRLVGSKLLEQVGQEVSVASSGREALELLAQESVDLLLLDLQMPEIDGFQVFDTLELRPTPRPLVVALTADARDDTRTRCLALGMEGFLEKPIQLERLKDTLIRLYQGNRATSTQG